MNLIKGFFSVFFFFLAGRHIWGLSQDAFDLDWRRESNQKIVIKPFQENFSVVL